jgi:hypothetical protein
MPRFKETSPWDASTTAEEAFEDLKGNHRLQSKLYKKTKSNPNPPLSYDPVKQQVVAQSLTPMFVSKLLKSSGIEFLIEISTSNPQGGISTGRFPAPKSFFNGEQIKEITGYKTVTSSYNNYQYQRPIVDSQRVGDPLYYHIRIQPERATQWTYNRVLRRGEYEEVDRMRCTITPDYGKSGFIAFANILNRRA